MYRLEDIRTIHLEVTQRCQAACPMCDRNMKGQGVNPHINLDELTLEDCKKIFPPEFIKQLNTMFMCGNLGDPIVAEDTLEIFQYFREHNPTMWLSMNTNAGARDEKWWSTLAQTFGRSKVVCNHCHQSVLFRCFTRHRHFPCCQTILERYPFRKCESQSR